MISMSILVKQASPAEEAELSTRLMRYSRLTMILTFKALQAGADTDTLESLLMSPPKDDNSMIGGDNSSINNNSIRGFTYSTDSTATGAESGMGAGAVEPGESAKKQELITEEERQWLLAATPGNSHADTENSY